MLDVLNTYTLTSASIIIHYIYRLWYFLWRTNFTIICNSWLWLGTVKQYVQSASNLLDARILSTLRIQYITLSANSKTYSVIHIITSSAKNTHTHRFNGPLSGTTQVSQYQKGKTVWILLKLETVSGRGISWAICKSAPRSSRITMPVPHHSVFYRPDALPAAQPTASKHWRHPQRTTSLVTGIVT